MIVRESGIAAGLGWAAVLWSWAFTCSLAYWGDDVTSRQWQYLMTVPGKQWLWVAVFGTAAITLAAGLGGRWYRLRAVGAAIIGVGCTAIATFYMWAPLLDNGLITLGFFPWFVPAGLGFLGAVINWRPIQWF